MKQRRIKTIYIEHGAPWENGYIESFHDKLRDECLNREIFCSLLEAQVVIEQWCLHYNAERPHSSLKYRTPDEFAATLLLSTAVGLRPPCADNCEIKNQNQWQDSSAV